MILYKALHMSDTITYQNCQKRGFFKMSAHLASSNYLHTGKKMSAQENASSRFGSITYPPGDLPILYFSYFQSQDDSF